MNSEAFLSCNPG